MIFTAMNTGRRRRYLEMRDEADLIPAKIVIPIYKDQLDACEQISLDQCCKTLSAWPAVFVKPKSLDTVNLQRDYPSIETKAFDDGYFASLAGYNRLMMSQEFYERFADCRYILIYQLDAYVFRDELQQWCRRGYDYIGAPWLLKRKYSYFPLWLFLRIKTILRHRELRPFAENRVGNGGLSLRRVASHLEVCKAKKSLIARFVERCRLHSEFNEDVFWATQNPEFRYPDLHEALLFSISEQPLRCLTRAGGRLPFGCHGWSKPSRIDFWRDKIAMSRTEG
ncbi:MAG: hypothetical protein LBH06_03375 [Rikenellaceae bacterium]|nr:hypothetical protein [Rikenellaceae bacterium]